MTGAADGDSGGGAVRIRPFDIADTEQVVALWRSAGLVVPWNDPYRDIERKLAVQPELFLVGESDGVVVATAMVGFDGHRGWVNYLAVDTDRRGERLGSLLMAEAERLLTERGCPKLNLQVRSTNAGVIAFYRSLGYQVDDVTSLGKRLIPDAAAG
ncbi:ribosomal protein S18 acetylase RimI-like enzyme [Agromyces cerinus]|uniref:GNAT family acetyltransferase n=1 Tax=Agromyces cerinus TaxID=33878 RepID=UPI0027DD5295|nr:GNAT family acetyltransferase [Agromyces cerinus]MBM7830155.1 ribosomal protein S18 acetylase RimI-like enzyme [Agromyces cerinus]